MDKGKRKKGSVIGWLTLIFIPLISFTAVADSQRIVDFNYDDAGNLISLHVDHNPRPPDVTSLIRTKIVSQTSTSLTVQVRKL